MKKGSWLVQCVGVEVGGASRLHPAVALGSSSQLSPHLRELDKHTLMDPLRPFLNFKNLQIFVSSSQCRI